jgi:hypothetical protein
LSPFTTFEIDMTGVQSYVSQYTASSVAEIVLVMQVETTAASDPLSWVTTCQ